MKITQIRNATLKIEFGGINFLIDPWLNKKNSDFLVHTDDPEKNLLPGPLYDLPMKPGEIIKDIDFCLLTHLHFDHFSGSMLPKTLNLILQNRNDYEKVFELGFSRISYFRDPVLQIDEVTIHRVDGQHGETTSISQRMGPVSGYIFTSPNEKTLYLAGDTVYYEGIEKTIDSFQPDIIVVNACDARIPEGRLIMDGSDVEKICQYSRHATIVATHMDNVNHGYLTRTDLKEQLKESGFDDRLLIPDDGEVMLF